MRRVHLALLVAGLACSNDGEPDAYGNFESTEVVVSAESAGQIEKFVPVEGMRLARGAVVALIDTTQLALEQRQVQAQKSATGSRSAETAAQIRVLDVQRDVARRTYERTKRLHAEQAATTQQLDQAERDYRTLVAQIAAARAQQQSVAMDVASAQARVEQIRDRISRSTVTNPRSGIVLATYARAGEVIQPGQPLYRVADLDTLVLRAYLSGSQLASVRLGQRVEVKVDAAGGELRVIPGTVTWISGTAEFTPTPVQTREDRTDLVYAVKVSVANTDGMLKIGMPGDITLAPAVATASK
jgi:HlyD family secretion protein